jgi:hypothetical protein
MSKTPGFIYALTNPTHPDLNHERFNKWYDEVHVPDVVNSGMAELALRYKNLNPDAKYQYLAVYRIPDLGFMADPEKMKAIRTNHELLPGKNGGGGGLLNEVADVGIKVLQQIQQFEPGFETKTGKKKPMFGFRNDDSNEIGNWLQSTLWKLWRQKDKLGSLTYA